MLRYRALIVILAIVSGFHAWYQNSTAPRYYTTTASFMPQGARGQRQASGLGQQFGLGGGDAGQAPAFYVDRVESPTLLAAVANHVYSNRTDSGVITGTIDKIYGIRETNPAALKARMIDAVKGQLEKKANPRTGIVTIKVRSRTPDMALQIARNILDEVNKFNLNWQQAQAGAERTFVEKRLGEAQMELRHAEENLQSFLTENREFESSPTLQLEYDRLNRAVSMRQQLYNGLAQAYEQAKIEEVRDLPVTTVVDPPEMPLAPEAQGGTRKTLLGIVVGAAIGIVIAFGAHLVKVLTRNRESDDYMEFAELSREAMQDLTRPWSILTRPFVRRTREV